VLPHSSAAGARGLIGICVFSNRFAERLAQACGSTAIARSGAHAVHTGTTLVPGLRCMVLVDIEFSQEILIVTT
jgi:hypothetical protein